MDFNIKFRSLASGSSGNCYLVEGYETKIMLEAGISIKDISIGINHKFSSIDACFVTHLHKDHCKSMSEVASRGVYVYALPETIKTFRLNHKFKEIERIPRIQDDPIYKTISIGEFEIKPFHVEHDVPNVGFVIDSKLSGERLVFIIDTYYSKFTFDNMTHIVIECNHSEPKLKEQLDKCFEDGKFDGHLQRLWTSHMSIERLIEFFKSNDLSNVKEIHLTHLSKFNSDEDLFKEKIESLTGKNVSICKSFESIKNSHINQKSLVPS